MRGFRLTVTRQPQQRAGEPFLAGVEQLIDQIFFDPDVPGQHVRQEPIRKSRPGVKLPHHFLSVDDDDGARGHGGRGRHPLGLPGKAALAEEVCRFQHGDHRLFSGVRDHRRPNGASLDVQRITNC
jgi:hypothetical protein